MSQTAGVVFETRKGDLPDSFYVTSDTPTGAGQNNALFAFVRQQDSDTSDLPLAKTWFSQDLKEAIGIYCFLPHLPDDPETFVSTIQAAYLRSPALRAFQRLLWIADPDNLPDEKKLIQNPTMLPQMLIDVKQRIVTPPLEFCFHNSVLRFRGVKNVQGDIGANVSLNADQTGFQFVDPNPAKDRRLTLAQDTSVKGSLDVDVQSSGVELTLPFGSQGLFSFNVELNQQNLDQLDVGLRYFWKDTQTNDVTSRRYPVVQLSDEGPGASKILLNGNLDPWYAVNGDGSPSAERTKYYFLANAGGDAPLMATSLRTTLNQVVSLTPQVTGDSRAALVFSRQLPADAVCNLCSGGDSATPAFANPVKDNEYQPRYLTPAGDFSIGVNSTIANGNPIYQHQLLCGLSGTEYISVKTGDPPPANADLLHFVPEQAACSQVTFQNGRPGQAGQPLFSGLSADYTTSWMTVLPAAAVTNRWYYSEPAGSPFFQHTQSQKSELLLDYLPLSQSKLPDTAGTSQSPNCFPMVPYAAYENGSAAENVAAFEFQILNPHRKQRIYDMAHPSASHDKVANITVEAPDSAVDGVALTPQGAVNRFANGDWNLIRFAEIKPKPKQVGKSIQYLSVAPSEKQTSLPQPLQNAFLTNQQFLVISIDNDNLGVLTKQLEMSGWTMRISPPPTQTVGDYKNVLIFKSAVGTISDWVSTPEKWTSYAEFNDATLDPDGLYLSKWLVDYLQQAKTAYDGGRGAAAFANFCDLIDDSDWSGFLVLKCDLEPGGLPNEIAALTAGIDQSRFYAHHLGSEITQAKPDTADPLGYSQQSDIFALVYYTDPAYARSLASGGGVPMIQMSSDNYDYKVLSLIVSFTNSVLTTFSSKLMLLMNELFGSSVLTNSPDPNFPATNRLLLDGGVQKRDGIDVYSFTTSKGVVSNFYLDSDALSSVRVDRAEFGVYRVTGSRANSGTEHFESGFTMWGAFDFSPGPSLNDDSAGNGAGDEATFDLFSYLALGYSNLAINMSFDLQVTNQGIDVSNRVLSFDSSTMTLDQQKLQIVPASETDLSSGINYARQGSLLSQFPLKLKGFVQSTPGNPRSPASLGYGSITVPALNKAGWSGELKAADSWYGLEYSLDIGTMGALAKNLVFTADLLFGWNPENGTWYAGMKLPGLGPLDKLLDLEGVIKFGAQEVLFDRVPVETSAGMREQYVIKFASIGLTVLSVTFPAQGSTNVVLFSDPDDDGTTPPTTLGWYGSYVQPGQTQKALPAPE